MKIEEIIVTNIKSSGCENELLKLYGVSTAEVFNEKDIVKVPYDDTVNRQVIIDKLHSLGYPEATEKNGLLMQLKSYTSCKAGRVNNLTQSTISQ